MVFIALGSNLGNRFEMLQKAVSQLNQEVGKIESVSRVFETPAWGFESDRFLNSCVEIKTKHTPLELINILTEIENKLGRNRDESSEYRARSIDLDILLFNNCTINYKHLQIPHPQMEFRQFVLVPLADIAADIIHPKLNKTIIELQKICPDDSALSLWNEELKI